MTFTFAAAALQMQQSLQLQRPPPAIHQFPKRQKTLDAAKTTSYTVHNVSIKFSTAMTNDFNVRNKAAALFATMQQVDPSLAVLPLQDKALPPLLSGPLFPTEKSAFSMYFTVPTFDSRSAKVHVYMQTTARFNWIKFNPFVHSHLKKHKI